MRAVNPENSIRQIVRSSVEAFADGFEAGLSSEIDNSNEVIDMKIHNALIAALGSDIQYYSALVRSLDSSLGNMLDRMAVNIARLFYEVNNNVEGVLYPEETSRITDLLIGKDIWNFVCKSDDGYDLVSGEYKDAVKNLKHKKVDNNLHIFENFNNMSYFFNAKFEQVTS